MSETRMDDREFAQSVGLNPNDLEWLVKDAPAVAADVRERIRGRVHAAIGESDAVAAPPGALTPPGALASPEAPVPTPAGHRRYLRVAAAAAMLLLLSGSVLVATSEAAQEKLKQLFLLVPGFGIKAADDQTRVLAAPMTVRSAGKEGVISAVVAGKDSTQVRIRITGLPRTDDGGAPMRDESWGGTGPRLHSEFPAELVLPDGTRMTPYTIKAHFDEGTLVATLTFGSLPPKVATVRLEVPTYRGIALDIAADLRLTGAGAVHFLEAVPTDAVRELNGVKVEALHYAIDDTLINFTLSVTPTEPNVSLGNAILGEYRWVDLADETDHSYPLSESDSDRPNGPSTPVLDAAGRPVLDPSGRPVFDGLGQQYNVAFVGPFRKGSEELILSVQKVRLQERASTAYTLNVADMSVGSSRQLDQTIQVGNWPVIVKSVTRKEYNQFAFALDLGKPVGSRELTYVSAGVGSSQSALGKFSSGEQMAIVRIEPQDGVIRFEWVNPLVTVTGPWVINVPLNR